MNISFTDQQSDYIAAQVASGDYRNASEVVREALRLHRQYRQMVINDLRAQIEAGWDGATSGRSVQDIAAAHSVADY
ncbi:addiction module antitoxin [Salinisphaera japonica YTM-1]|uniref:Antitoxin ParD n=2 Tax=Salinisphaera TaxID=180541 RepID=A0A423PPL4_9GAMM|nr:addiction module antitoxin [Salinisphaera japonica YTM-1]